MIYVGTPYAMYNDNIIMAMGNSIFIIIIITREGHSAVHGYRMYICICVYNTIIIVFSVIELINILVFMFFLIHTYYIYII